MATIPPLKWWGGKTYLAPKLIDLMPRHLHYVEPYAGGLAVLLHKDPFDERHQWGNKSHEQGISEVVNDIYRPLQNFWDVLQSETSFCALQRILETTPFSEIEFQRAERRMFPDQRHDVEAAASFFVRCRQSRAGGFRDFATLSRNRTRRKQNEQASAWWGAVDGLGAVHARLKRVVVLCRNALDVIRQQDGPKTLFYLDPPYLHSTRATTGNYAYEMDEADHRQMLDAIIDCQGAVMLSGYPNDLYDQILSGWNRHDFLIDNKAAGGKAKRIMTESVWCNF
jgi:DNA adenine methylase